LKRTIVISTIHHSLGILGYLYSNGQVFDFWDRGASILTDMELN
jgi:hypothetical protein